MAPAFPNRCHASHADGEILMNAAHLGGVPSSQDSEMRERGWAEAGDVGGHGVNKCRPITIKNLVNDLI